MSISGLYKQKGQDSGIGAQMKSVSSLPAAQLSFLLLWVSCWTYTVYGSSGFSFLLYWVGKLGENSKHIAAPARVGSGYVPRPGP